MVQHIYMTEMKNVPKNSSQHVGLAQREGLKDKLVQMDI